MASEASQGGEARHEASGVEQEQGERQEQEEGLKGEGDDQEDQDAIQTQLLETLKDTQVADGDEASPSQVSESAMLEHLGGQGQSKMRHDWLLLAWMPSRRAGAGLAMRARLSV